MAKKDCPNCGLSYLHDDLEDCVKALREVVEAAQALSGMGDKPVRTWLKGYITAIEAPKELKEYDGTRQGSVLVKRPTVTVTLMVDWTGVIKNRHDGLPPQGQVRIVEEA